LKFEVLPIWYSDFEPFFLFLSRRDPGNDEGEGEERGGEEGKKGGYYNPTNPKKKKKRTHHIFPPNSN